MNSVEFICRWGFGGYGRSVKSIFHLSWHNSLINMPCDSWKICACWILNLVSDGVCVQLLVTSGFQFIGLAIESRKMSGPLAVLISFRSIMFCLLMQWFQLVL